MNNTRNKTTLHEAIYTLRAMRRLKTDPIPLEDLRYVVDAATMACSPGNSQTWRFLVITDTEQKRKIGEIYRRVGLKAIKEGALASGLLDEAAEKVYRNAMILVDHLQDAPALIMCCMPAITEKTNSEKNSINQSTHYGAIYPAIQNLMLAARAKGLGTTMTTLHKADESAVKDVLQIPDDIETVALIPLGYPEGKWGKPLRRPSQEVTYWNRWGEQAE